MWKRKPNQDIRATSLTKQETGKFWQALGFLVVFQPFFFFWLDYSEDMQPLSLQD